MNALGLRRNADVIPQSGNTGSRTGCQTDGFRPQKFPEKPNPDPVSRAVPGLLRVSFSIDGRGTRAVAFIVGSSSGFRKFRSRSGRASAIREKRHARFRCNSRPRADRRLVRHRRGRRDLSDKADPAHRAAARRLLCRCHRAHRHAGRGQASRPADRHRERGRGRLPRGQRASLAGGSGRLYAVVRQHQHRTPSTRTSSTSFPTIPARTSSPSHAPPRRP